MVANKLSCTVHEIAKDGLPDMDNRVPGSTAFLFEGCIVSGWPLDDDKWEADSDVGHERVFFGVTHWVEFNPSLIEFITER